MTEKYAYYIRRSENNTSVNPCKGTRLRGVYDPWATKEIAFDKVSKLIETLQKLYKVEKNRDYLYLWEDADFVELSRSYYKTIDRIILNNFQVHNNLIYRILDISDDLDLENPYNIDNNNGMCFLDITQIPDKIEIGFFDWKVSEDKEKRRDFFSVDLKKVKSKRVLNTLLNNPSVIIREDVEFINLFC